jgi:hypothetical protein
MKVIFLDVDGVLHPMKDEMEPFEPGCMQALKAIVDSTGASIVLSSSWRCLPGCRAEVDSALALAGIVVSFDRTPVKGFRSRVAEICHWLKQHPAVETYCVLDDMDLGAGKGGQGRSALANNFINTDPTTGLTAADVVKAVSILNGSSAVTGVEPQPDDTVAAADDYAPAADIPEKRTVFISASKLAAQWRAIPSHDLQAALCFFGSKRRWLFPSTSAETREAAAQPGRYHMMEPEFLALIAAKEARGEVHFLKAAELQYAQYPGPPDGAAYGRASQWLQGLGFLPLRLDPCWWRSAAGQPDDGGKLDGSGKDRGLGARSSAALGAFGGGGGGGRAGSSMPERVIANFEAGHHEYAEVVELLLHSDCRLQPVYSWPLSLGSPRAV